MLIYRPRMRKTKPRRVEGEAARMGGSSAELDCRDEDRILLGGNRWHGMQWEQWPRAQETQVRLVLQELLRPCLRKPSLFTSFFFPWTPAGSLEAPWGLLGITVSATTVENEGSITRPRRLVIPLHFFLLSTLC